MIRHYTKVAFRSLWRNRMHTTINILGLGLGIVCCVLIALFVRNEWTFDTFHTKADRIYRVYAREDWGENQQFFNTITPFPMGPALKENFPEVESQVRFNFFGSQTKVKDKTFAEQVSVGGIDFFKVFDFEVADGNLTNVFDDNHAIVITERMAHKYFGDANPIGQAMALQIGEQLEDFVVKAVIKDIPTNSSIRFNLIISELNYTKLYNPRALNAWFNINPETYVLLSPGADPKQLEAKFPALFLSALGEEEFKNSHYQAGLQPLTSIHLDTSYPAGLAPVGNPSYVYILGAIAVLILVIACINFVTLSVGKSMKRAKEVGIRKVVGAARRQLVGQFIGEAVLVTVISMTIGLVASRLLLPLFNELAGKELEFTLDQFLVFVTISLLVVIGLLAGSYPALVLSGFRPIVILKGMSKSGSRQTLRKVLVGVQLTLSIFLIASTLIMRNQLQFLQNKDLGYNKEQLAVIPLYVKPAGRFVDQIKTGFAVAEQFKSELARLPGIVSVAAASHDFGNGNWTNIGYTDDTKVYRTFFVNTVDDEYIKTLNMEMVQGRNFSDSIPSDKRRGVIINESMAKELGWTDAIGKKLPGKGFQDHEIIGVVKDFHYASLYARVGSLVLVEDLELIRSGSENINVDNSPIPKLIVRLAPGSMAQTVESIHEVWDRISIGGEFALNFADEALARQYRSDQNLGRVISVAALLAILIGSLGLYGLASLAMQNRIKEIGIRKVMGATQGSLLYLLTREYVVLIIVCLVISIPVTLYWMQSWLAVFQYKVSIGWLSFGIAGFISLFIAAFAIGFQTLKAAATDPAKTLKYE